MGDLARYMIGALVVALIFVLVVYVHSTREARYAAAGVLAHRVAVTQSQIDAWTPGSAIQHELTSTQRR